MKVRLPRQEFQDALTAIATVASGRTPKPILNCVKLALAGEHLELCATDGEAALRVNIVTIATEVDGACVVPAERLLSIVREMSDIEMTLEVSGPHCLIRGEGSEFKIFTQAVEDFPPVPEFEGEPDLRVDASELQRMIAMTVYAAARETSRYAINGVLWDKRGKKLFLVATDGRRLARAGGTLRVAQSGDFQLIVPSKALNVLEKVLTHHDEADDAVIDVRVLPNQIVLRSGGRILATALVEGAFPKYEDVIPKDNDKVATIDSGELRSAIRRAALLTTEDSRAVRMQFTNGELIITANAPEQGEARVQTPIEYKHDPVEIGFNPHFIIDALKAAPYDTINIELQESFRPGVLTGDDRNAFLYVVMPVSLNNSR